MLLNIGASINLILSRWPPWIGLAIIFSISVFALRLLVYQFGYQFELIDMPIVQFTLVYIVLGLLCAFALPLMIRQTPEMSQKSLLFFILVIAVLLRLGLQGVPSVLEDDYNRYLWDGAVTVSGLNPYSYSPEQILGLREEGGIFDVLIKQSNGIFGLINHPEFSTVYPPIAQAVFAFSYWISPFNLDALRLVLFVLDIGCMALILLILQQLGKPLLWVVLYAWNPLVIKEISNSVHMEPILMLPVLATVYLVLKQRLIFASGTLAIAAGVKIWPALLIVVIWRELLVIPKKLIYSGMVFVIILCLMVAPILLTGLSETSGFVAFGGQWQASSAVYLISEWAAYLLTPYWVEDYIDIPLVSRLFLAVILLSVIAFVCFKKARDETYVVWRMFIITASIYLLAPSHTPWYFIWVVPFLCLFPSRGLLLAGALIPAHYVFFHFSARGLSEVYQTGIVWLIWCPVWALLLYDFLKLKMSSKASGVCNETG